MLSIDSIDNNNYPGEKLGAQGHPQGLKGWVKVLRLPISSSASGSVNPLTPMSDQD